MAQINKSSEYFNTVLWTGNATDNRSITGVNFKPDLVWYKERSSTSWNNLQDVVRGTGKQIHSNSTEPETTNNGTIKAFETDGFQIGTEADINESGQTYVGWNWLADNTSGSSNTDGSITSTVSTNTTSGFSIVSYTGNGTTGATIGHGLGVAPKMIITKQRDGAGNWFVYHKSLPVTEYIILNSTVASQTDNEIIYNDTTPSSTTFTVGNYSQINGSSNTFISYCFAEKKGFSKFGSYTGNGNADGTFVYTGFKPMWVLFKRTDSANGWYLYDSVRDPENQNTKALIPSNSDAEQNESGIDLLSNGFKLRNADGSKNTSGGEYIYMAFAENPLVGTNNIPATAR